MQTLIEIEGVVGSPFDDRLIGSAAPNAIDGGAGADTIDGGEGADRLAGGGGIDAIESRDTSADSVSCGEGPDNLAVDSLDTVAPDCAPPRSGPAVACPAAARRWRPGRARARRQRAAPVAALGSGARTPVALTCSTACRAGGRLALAPAAARRLGIGRRAASHVGRLAPVDLAAGDPVERRIRLTRTARRALRDAHRVALVLRAHALDDAGRAAAPLRLPVKLRAS